MKYSFLKINKLAALPLVLLLSTSIAYAGLSHKIACVILASKKTISDFFDSSNKELCPAHIQAMEKALQNVEQLLNDLAQENTNAEVKQAVTATIEKNKTILIDFNNIIKENQGRAAIILGAKLKARFGESKTLLNQMWCDLHDLALLLRKHSIDTTELEGVMNTLKQEINSLNPSEDLLPILRTRLGK